MDKYDYMKVEKYLNRVRKFLMPKELKIIGIKL